MHKESALQNKAWATSLPGKQAISTDNFLNVYFDRRHKDLKLLLNLLAETSGLPESFRILTLLDKKFQSLWKPQNLRFEEYETVLPNQKIRSHSIVVRSVHALQFPQKNN